MISTLMVGDLILVNKYHYGIRLPVLNTKVTDGNPVERGDVMVFRYPPQPTLDYIKRVVGVPGDTVAYLNKRLTINGQEVPTKELPDFLTRMPCVTSRSLKNNWGRSRTSRSRHQGHASLRARCFGVSLSRKLHLLPLKA